MTDADLHADLPPPDPPWTLPFARCPFALIDCEMTGLDPARDALLEVAVARVQGGVLLDRYTTLVRTEVPSVPGAAALHGIEPAAVLDAPDFAEVAPRLDALLDGAVPVMHGVDLDVRFLDRAFADAGNPRRVGPALDTLRLARRALHARHYNLSALCGPLDLGPVRWHRAGEDVRALVALFARLCAALDPVDAMDLWQVRAADGRVQVRAAIARTLAEAAGTARPIRMVVRTPGHAERELTARVLWFRPPHVGLSRAGSAPVPAILRADRVLRVVG